MQSANLGQLEEQLKRLAQHLAALNLQHNDVLVNIQQAQRDIGKLVVRRDKRLQLIQQEESDKMIIHENLKAASREVMRLRSTKGIVPNKNKKAGQSTSGRMSMESEPACHLQQLEENRRRKSHCYEREEENDD